MVNLKLSVVLVVLVIAGCSSVTPPPECSGAPRKVNPETVLSSISCMKAVG